MLVYFVRDSLLVYGLMEICEDSPPHARELAIEVPGELIARHRKAQGEYDEVQELLREKWHRGND